MSYTYIFVHKSEIVQNCVYLIRFSSSHNNWQNKRRYTRYRHLVSVTIKVNRRLFTTRTVIPFYFVRIIVCVCFFPDTRLSTAMVAAANVSAAVVNQQTMAELLWKKKIHSITYGKTRNFYSYVIYTAERNMSRLCRGDRRPTSL